MSDHPDSSRADDDVDQAMTHTTRRTVLKAGALGSAGVAILALARRGFDVKAVDPDALPEIRSPRVAGASSHLIPNVPVTTHTGQRRWFYDDLVHDRIAVINFMSIRGDATYPVTENLARVQRLLGQRVGGDITMLSVTVDPEHDTPEALAAFAAEKGAGPGWTFLSGGRKELSFLRSFLFVRRPRVTASPMQDVTGPCCSGGLARYGNERLCHWGSFPLKISPEFIATRFRWIGFREGDAASHV